MDEIFIVPNLSDALEARFAGVTDPCEKIDLLNELAWQLHHLDPARSHDFCIQARELASETDPPYTDGLARSLSILSALEWEVSNYQTAFWLALEARGLLQTSGNLKQLAFVTNHLASISFYLGDYPHALELGYEALRLVERSGDEELQASLLNDVAYYQIHVGEFSDALPQLLKSLQMHRKIGSKAGETQTLDSLGKAYYLMGDYAQALAYELQSLDVNRVAGYKRAETEATHHIGKIYAASGDYSQAFFYFEQALQQAQERGYKLFEAAILLDMGRGCAAKQETALAFKYLMQGLAVAETLQALPVIFEIHEALAGVYEQVGDTTRALAHYKQFHNIREEVLNEKNSSRLHNLQVIHETEQAKHKAEIYQLKNVALQREIEERETLIAELDAFAHTVAHDLKNPLSVILGYSEIVQAEIKAQGYESALKMAGSLEQATRKAGRIVDELLLLSRVRQKEVIPHPIDMAEVIHQVEKRLAYLIQDNHVTLIKPQRWPAALGYAPWIEEVWANYITNAIKYGGSPPSVELGATLEGGFVRFWVRDNGDGITAEDQKRLFVAFTRLNQTRPGGHGLGLSIVKRIVEKLGGTVGVESTGIAGQGSRFSFTLAAQK